MNYFVKLLYGLIFYNFVISQFLAVNQYVDNRQHHVNFIKIDLNHKITKRMVKNQNRNIFLQITVLNVMHRATLQNLEIHILQKYKY